MPLLVHVPDWVWHHQTEHVRKTRRSTVMAVAGPPFGLTQRLGTVSANLQWTAKRKGLTAETVSLGRRVANSPYSAIAEAYRIVSGGARNPVFLEMETVNLS